MSLYSVALDTLQEELTKYKLPCIAPKRGTEYGTIRATTKIKDKKEKMVLFISQGMYKKDGGKTPGNINIPMLRFQMQSAIRKLLKKHGYSPDVPEDLIRDKIHTKYTNRIKSPKCKNDALKRETFNLVQRATLYTRYKQSDKTWEKWVDQLIARHGDKTLARIQKEMKNAPPSEKKAKTKTPYAKKPSNEAA